MANQDNMSQELLPLIEHKVDNSPINQRAADGYVNATALCQACNKQLGHYLQNKNSREFFEALRADIGIPISELIQIVKGGHPELQGTWVHPQVAINLGQWASPRFAVLVSKWVFEWMSGNAAKAELPDHIKRYLINRHKIPPTHFSMLDQMTLKLLAPLEQNKYMIPATMMPDIALGKMFSRALRDSGHDPERFPSYTHEFTDHRRNVRARLYPNEVMTEFNVILDNWVRDGRALEYFRKRDQRAIEPLKKVFAELPKPDEE